MLGIVSKYGGVCNLTSAQCTVWQPYMLLPQITWAGMQITDGGAWPGTQNSFIDGGQGEVLWGHRHHRKSIKEQRASSSSADHIHTHPPRLPKTRTLYLCELSLWKGLHKWWAPCRPFFGVMSIKAICSAKVPSVFPSVQNLWQEWCCWALPIRGNWSGRHSETASAWIWASQAEQCSRWELCQSCEDSVKTQK